MASTSTHVPKERDLSAHCRVCLQLPEEDQVLDVNLIYDEEEQLSYYNCFVICTQIDLDDGVGMPHNLCKLCGIELQMAYDFYKKVDTARRCLQEMEDNACKEDLAEMDGFQTVEQCDKLIIEDPEVLEDDMTSEAAEEAQDTLSPDAQDTLSPDAQDALSQDVQDAEEKLIEHDNYMEIEDFDSIEGLEEREEEAEETLVSVSYLLSVEKQPEEPSAVPLQMISPLDVIEDRLIKINDTKKQAAAASGYIHKITEEVIVDEEFSYDRNAPDEAQVEETMKNVVKTVRPTWKVFCDICQKEYQNRSKMLWHRRIHDANRPRFRCPHPSCERLYTSKQASDLHYRQTHLDEGLRCSICDKHFIIRQALDVHMRYHNGEFPFECFQCDKKFAQKGHLTTHMQVKHNNLRYICTHAACGKIFKNSMSLRNHRFMHTGMPFKCAFCNKGYPQKGKLKTHISRKHNLKIGLDELESMRKFKDVRTRHSLMKLKDQRLEARISADEEKTKVT